MKKTPMILLLAVPYLVITVCYLLMLDMIVGLCVYGALLLFNLVYAFQMPKLGFDGKQILFWNLLLKLGNIPLAGLIRVAALVLLMVGGERLQDMSVSMVAIALLVLFLVRLSSSVFGISGFRWYRKQGLLSKGAEAALSILQFIPFVDVPSAILCYIRLRKKGQYAEQE